MRPGCWRAQGVHIAGRFTGRVPVAVLADTAGPVEFCLLPLCARPRCGTFCRTL